MPSFDQGAGPSAGLQINTEQRKTTTISVNDQRISLSNLDTRHRSRKSDTEGSETDQSSPRYTTQRHSSDSDTIQAIYDLLDEVNEEKEAEEHTKYEMWLRRLIVVILLNFLMRFRRKFGTFSELILPIIVFVVLVFGMVINSEGNAVLGEEKEKTTIGEFEQISIKSIMQSYCANAEYCKKASDRHYFIVYSPKNKFNDDLMSRVLDFLEAGTGVKEESMSSKFSNLSQLIAVNTSEDVAKMCEDHWDGYHAKRHEEGEDHGHNAGQPESLDPHELIKYPMGIIFSYEGGLIAKDRLEKIVADEDLPRSLSFNIRTYYGEAANTVEGFPVREHEIKNHDRPNNPYLHTGILGMQIAIDLAFAEKIVEHSVRSGKKTMQIGKSSENPIYVDRQAFFRGFAKEISLKEYQYPSYKGPLMRLKGWVVLVMIILLSFICCDITISQEIIHEQQRGSIELLKIHGMTTSMRWIAYLLITAVLRLLTTLPIALTIHYLLGSPSIVSTTSFVGLWYYLFIYSLTSTCFNYFFTTGFGIKKMELAGMVVACISFLISLLSVHLLHLMVTASEKRREEELDKLAKGESIADLEGGGDISRMLNGILSFLLPQWNLVNGIYFYMRYELYEDGMTWYDFPVIIDSQHHRILAVPFLYTVSLYTILFYLCLTIYMDHILPREFSPKEHWLFFLQPLMKRTPSQSKPTRPISKSQRPSVYERGPRDAAFGPRFRNVTLTDGLDKNTVLDNISLDIYEGEVTCIVGQIGSGKSDFLNVIAGVKVPSGGFVDVKGLRVNEFHDITNKHVSLCPQRSLLLETLSVEDHIRLCCMLHGASYGKAKLQGSFLLKMFGLSPMRRHNYKGLTVSDKQKLMAAMALSKSPSILLLDNPIDQLDSESSIEFWKLLQELKQQRTIVITCTKLEEAQMYGDRIAVLSKGKLVCYGTPSFLKAAYGLGNIISLYKVPAAEIDIEELKEFMNKELDGGKVQQLETKGIALQNDAVKFILPYGKLCSEVLKKLEDNMEVLNLLKVSMSQPTLWTLFHVMSEHTGIERVLARREARILRGVDEDEHLDLEAATLPSVPVSSVKIKGATKWHSTVSILVMKKIWYYRQKYWTTLLAYIGQIVLLIQMTYFARMFLIEEPEGMSKSISTRMYQHNQVLIRSADNEHTREAWNEALTSVLKQDDDDIQLVFLEHGDDIEAKLGKISDHTLTSYYKQTIISFNRDASGHTGYFSSNSIHSAAVASHVMMQAFLYMISPNREQPYESEMIMHPFTPYPGFPASSTQSISSTILGLFMALILTLMSAPSLRMILTEKNTRFKMIQRMAGVSSSMYWFTHGIADAIIYGAVTLLSCGLIIFVDRIGYNKIEGGSERLALFYIIGAWLCWSGIPYSYFVTQVFSVRLTGFGVYVVLLFLTGIVPKIITYQFLRLSMSGFTIFLRYALYLFPPYTLTSACVHYFHVIGDKEWCSANTSEFACDIYTNNITNLLDNLTESEFHQQELNGTFQFIKNQITYNHTFRTCCKKFCNMTGSCHHGLEFFPSLEQTVIPGLLHDMFGMLINGFMFWILVICIEKNMIKNSYDFIVTKLCGNLEKTVAERDVKVAEEPEDVKNEHQKVDYMVEIEADVDTEVYLVQDVTKFYAYTKGLDHVYFSVPINTITGILGLPKTGKTTLLEILTTQLSPSAGYVYKDNDLIDRRSRKYLMRNVGYCPQKSCLLPYLTGAQMLTIMGKLRGLSSEECDQHVHWWLKLFGLEDVGYTKCMTYRKGQERRLCCALALIGDTTVIIMDEPTACMDNLEKYMFWNVMSRISAATTLSRTILFTSAEAEEVQQQSAKVLVLDAGIIVAVGQLSEIFRINNQGMLLAIRYGVTRNKYYTEYQTKARIDRFKDHVIQYLSPCALVDEQENLLIYHLKDQTLKLSRIYAVMEAAKLKFPSVLEHFQVFEQSLDDVILKLHKAKYKRHTVAGAEEGIEF